MTPLYLERIHILYSVKSYADKAQPVGEVPPHFSPGNPETTRFFQRATISTGPHGSGSKVFATYLLSQLHANQDNPEVHELDDLSLGFDKALEGLQEGTLDAVFTIAGAPLSDVAEKLETNKDIRLMSIDPVLVPQLNKNFGLSPHFQFDPGIATL